MVDQQEKLWTFDAVEPGQVGNETIVEIIYIFDARRLSFRPRLDPKHDLPRPTGNMVLDFARCLPFRGEDETCIAFGSQES